MVSPCLCCSLAACIWLIYSLTSLVYSPLFLYDWATTERLRNPPENEEEDEVDEGWNYWDNPPVEKSSLTQNIEQFVWRGTCTGRQEESSLNYYWSLQQFLRESCRVWAWRDVERRRWWSSPEHQEYKRPVLSSWVQTFPHNENSRKVFRLIWNVGKEMMQWKSARGTRNL